MGRKSRTSGKESASGIGFCKKFRVFILPSIISIDFCLKDVPARIILTHFRFLFRDIDLARPEIIVGLIRFKYGRDFDNFGDAT